MTPMPPLKTLLPFYTVATELSFSRAADHLYVTHSAISQSVKQLEAFLGKKLFVRAGHKVTLTHDGELYFGQIKQALSIIHASTKSMLAGDGAATISINMLSSFAMHWLIPQLPSFKHSFPQYRLSLSSEWHHSDFLLEGIDVALYYGDGAWPGLDSILLRVERVALFASPAYVDEHRFDSLNDCLAEATFLYVKANLRQDNMSLWCKEKQLPEPDDSSRVYFQNTVQALQAAQYGAGIIAANELFLSHEVSSGALVKVLPDSVDTGQGYYLVTPDAYTGLAKINDFRQWLLACADASH